MNDVDDYADLYNGVTAAQIRAAVEAPAANARVIADIATELGTDADAVTGATEGDITSGGVRRNRERHITKLVPPHFHSSPSS